MHEKYQKLTLSAVMLALAVVLSLFAVFKLPNGGSVTIGSMVPIMFIAFKYDVKWSLLTAFAYSVLQMVLGFYPPPTQDFLSFVLVIMLDYVIAFTVLGLSGIIAKKLKSNSVIPYILGGSIAVAVRFICHFLSGILIWDVYAPEGSPVWLYSLTYNGSYMGLELIISVAILCFIIPFLKRYLPKY